MPVIFYTFKKKKYIYIPGHVYRTNGQSSKCT